MKTNEQSPAHPVLQSDRFTSEPGLSKVEHMATEIASAVLISGPVKKIGTLAEYSVQLAKLILAEANKTEAPPQETEAPNE